MLACYLWEENFCCVNSMFVALNGGWNWGLAADGAIPKLPGRSQCPRGKLLSVPCSYFSGKPHHFSKIGQICLILPSKPRVATLPGHGPETWPSPGVAPPVTVRVSGRVPELLFASGETVLFDAVFSQDPTPGPHVAFTFTCYLLFLASLLPLSFWCFGDYLSTKLLALKNLCFRVCFWGSQTEAGGQWLSFMICWFVFSSFIETQWTHNCLSFRYIKCSFDTHIYCVFHVFRVVNNKIEIIGDLMWMGKVGIYGGNWEDEGPFTLITNILLNIKCQTLV